MLDTIAALREKYVGRALLQGRGRRAGVMGLIRYLSHMKHSVKIFLTVLLAVLARMSSRRSGSLSSGPRRMSPRKRQMRMSSVYRSFQNCCMTATTR